MMIPARLISVVSVWASPLRCFCCASASRRGSVQAAISRASRRSASSITIEGGADFWFPTADLIVASGGSGALAGIPGTEINAKRDLGLADKNAAAARTWCCGRRGATNCGPVHADQVRRSRRSSPSDIVFNGQPLPPRACR